MDFDYSPKTKDLQSRLLKFMDDHIYPSEKAYAEELQANTEAGKRWSALKVIENLKPKARDAGLWNLFLPVDSAAASGYAGAGLTNQEYAPLAEIMGRVLQGRHVRRQVLHAQVSLAAKQQGAAHGLVVIALVHGHRFAGEDGLIDQHATCLAQGPVLLHFYVFDFGTV